MTSEVAKGRPVPRAGTLAQRLHAVAGPRSLLALAWLLSLAGTLALRGPSTLEAGVLLLFLAGCLAVQSLRTGGDAAWEAEISAARYLDIEWDRERTIRGAGVLASAILVWLADERFLRSHDAPFGLAGWLWVGSLAVLVVATAVWPAAPSSGEDGTIATRRADSRGEIAIVLAILALAVLLRLWDLRDIPYAIHSDEIMTGHVARTSFLQGTPVSVFITVWDNINLPALWFALVAGSLRAFGITLFALRLPAALFGALTVLPFYGMVREGWGRRAAVCGSLILAVSASQVHLSRVTLNNIVTPFFWAACFFFLLRGLRRGRPSDWALAGIAAGISEYGYYGTHLLPFVLFGFVVYLAIFHSQYSWECIGRYGLLGLGYVVAFGPLLAYYTQRPAIYLGRGQGVLTWDRIPTDWTDLQRMWHVLWPLISANLLGISTNADAGTVYWAPLLLPLEASLLVLGFALLLWQWRRPPAFLMLLSGLATLFVGGTLVHGVPFIEHWTPAFPAFYAAMALPFAQWGDGASPGPSRLQSMNLAVPGLLLLCLTSMDLVFYFHDYRAIRPEFEIRAAQTRWEASLGTGYRVYTAGSTWQSYAPETNEYLIQGQEGAHLLNAGAELPLPARPGKGVAFAFFADNAAYEWPVQSLYPGGSWGSVNSQEGVNLFTTYVVAPARVKIRPASRPSPYARGLLQVAPSLQGSVMKRSVSFLGFSDLPDLLSPGSGQPSTSATQVSWTGQIHATRGGRYLFTVRTDAAVTVRLDGRLRTSGCAAASPNVRDVSFSATLRPEWHSIQVAAGLTAGHELELYWNPLGGQLVLVPPSLLRHTPRGAVPTRFSARAGTCP